MQTSKLSETVNRLDGYDPDALPVFQAQQLIQQCVAPRHAPERVALRSALGRVLAADIMSPIDVPPHDNAAMDGFAMRSADLDNAMPVTLRIAGVALAGAGYEGVVETATCVRIMTGAPMPAGSDMVVPKEFVQAVTDMTMTIPAGVGKGGDHRRLKGEDLQAGSPALLRGRILRPADLGLIASLGIAEVPVQKQLRVAFFSTGNELRSLGEPLESGCVYDSNRYTLFGMLTRLGCDILDMGVVPDDPVLLETALRSACENADVVITSGGVSAGDADYTRQIMARLGDVLFWKLAMRPGRPMAFGAIASQGKSAYLFGLPGNPVAVMVTFYFFARAALLRLMGAEEQPLPLLRVTSGSAIRKKQGRTEYQRGILSRNADGRQEVCITGAQGSGILRSMSEANCMVILPHEQADVKVGDSVEVLLFDGLI